METTLKSDLRTLLRPAADFLVEHHPFYASLIRQIQFREGRVVAGLSVLRSDVVLVDVALFQKLECVEHQAHAVAQHALLLALGPFWQGANDLPQAAHASFARMSLALVAEENASWTPLRQRPRVNAFYANCTYTQAVVKVSEEPLIKAQNTVARAAPTAPDLEESRQRAFAWVARLVQAGQEARLLGKPSRAYAKLTEQALVLRSPWHAYLRSMLGRLGDTEISLTARGSTKRRAASRSR
jgi:hypothetical protein